MCTRWGYTLPRCNASCGVRALGRALKQRAVLHDASYHTPIQISTSLDQLEATLPSIMDPALVSEVLSARVLSSHQEAQFVIHEAHTFPTCAIGPITMSICPSDEKTDIKHVWFWSHPAIVDKVEALLHDLFSMQPIRRSDVARLSLFGSQALRMIANVIRPPAERDPVHQFLQEVPYAKAKKDLWRDGAILTCAALDCRHLSFAKGGVASVRTRHTSAWKKPMSSGITTSPRGQHIQMPDITPGSSLWSSEEVQRMNASVPTDTTINRERFAERLMRKSLLSGDTFQTSPIPSSIPASFPVAIIKRAARSSAYASIPLRHAAHSYPVQVSNRPELRRAVAQYDIIVPAAWLRVLWQALIFSGAFAVGLDEVETISTLQAVPSFPRDFIDTAAGEEYWATKKSVYDSIISKRPKNKRKIVSTVGCIPSIECLWSDVELDKPLAIVRNAAYIDALVPPALQGWNRYNYGKTVCACDDISPCPVLPFRTLVPIILRCTGRGVPAEGAELLCPTANEYALWRFHDEHKTDMQLSGKRLREWPGVQSEENRNPVGYITHGLQSTVSEDKIAIGLVEACRLHAMLCDALATGGTQYMLVLYRCRHAKWIRPALFDLST